MSIKKLLTRATLYLIRKRIITVKKTSWSEGKKTFTGADCIDDGWAVEQNGQIIAALPFFASGPKYAVTRKSVLGITLSVKREEIMVFVCRTSKGQPKRGCLF